MAQYIILCEKECDVIDRRHTVHVLIKITYFSGFKHSWKHLG